MMHNNKHPASSFSVGADSDDGEQPHSSTSFSGLGGRLLSISPKKDYVQESSEILTPTLPGGNYESLTHDW